MKSFCSLPWNHICLTSAGTLSPCCRYKDFHQSELDRSANLDEQINSDSFKSLRKKMLAGEVVAGCAACDMDENEGVTSYRQDSNIKFPSNALDIVTKPENIQLIEAYTSRVCNLKCLTCHPKNSTRWDDDYTKLGWNVDVPPPSKTQTLDFQDYKQLKEIKFIGGEPLLDKNHLGTLESLGKNISNVRLKYYTNSTIFPSQSVLSLWEIAQSVTVHLSIDGFGALNEYIRFPSSWKKVDETAKKYFALQNQFRNLTVGVHCTVSIYNFFDLQPLYSWLEEIYESSADMGDCKIKFSPLRTPEKLSIANIPQKILQAQALKYSEGPSSALTRFGNSVQSLHPTQLLNEFYEYTEALDAIRGNRLEQASPSAFQKIYAWRASSNAFN